MIRLQAFSFAAIGCIAVSAIIIVARPTLAHAQSADLVLCDRLAADPSDPDKPADVKGTSDVAAADVATAIKYCKVASASSRRALYQLGRAYAANRQLPEAMAVWRKAADKGSTSAMVELGVAYGTGAGVARDEAQARKLFERAAEAGNPRGVTNLAALSGSGGAQDDAGARNLFEKAAAQNHPGALERMGAFTQEGRGGPKDSGAAKAYYERAAALGDEDAKKALKRMECPYAIKDKRGNFVTNLCF